MSCIYSSSNDLLVVALAPIKLVTKDPVFERSGRVADFQLNSGNLKRCVIRCVPRGIIIWCSCATSISSPSVLSDRTIGIIRTQKLVNKQFKTQASVVIDRDV